MAQSQVDTADGALTIQKALEIARNSESTVDPAVREFLERTLQDLWTKIQDQPDSYLMNKDEFALFNYYRDRFTTSTVAQSAIQRFWANYRGDPSDFNAR